MIRIYCQYSYGGFRTFFIEGKEGFVKGENGIEGGEHLQYEVTNETDYDFPNEAHCYFQFGGAKIVYRYLNDKKLALVIREIPSIHRDGDGRSIPCAVQFIGDEADRSTLDYLALDIANDTLSFEKFFAKLFRVKQGLRIDGAKLRDYIENHNKKIICSTDVEVFRDVLRIQSGVMLFVHQSSNFGKDKIVTERVCKDLKFDIKELERNNCTMSVVQLMEYQNHVTFTEFESETSTVEIQETTKLPQPSMSLDDKDKIISELRKRIIELEKENAELSKKIRIGGYIIIGLLVLCIMLKCS